MKKYIPEAVGTFLIVFFSCGCVATIGNSNAAFAVAISLAITVILAYSIIGNFSGCHINPAISFSELLNKKIKKKEFFGYLLWQLIGGVVAALILVFIISQCQGYSISSLADSASNFGMSDNFGLTMAGAFILEAILTCIFILVYLKLTAEQNLKSYMGFIIGITFMFVNIIAIPLMGGAANFARSFAAGVVFGPFTSSPELIFQLLIFAISALLGTMGAVWLDRVFNEEKMNHGINKTITK